jgi:hypothetical protein
MTPEPPLPTSATETDFTVICVSTFRPTGVLNMVRAYPSGGRDRNFINSPHGKSNARILL